MKEKKCSTRSEESKEKRGSSRKTLYKTRSGILIGTVELKRKEREIRYGRRNSKLDFNPALESLEL